MANTKIPVELSSTPGIVDGSNATAITIDSSENVGIGTSSPSSKLHVYGGAILVDNGSSAGTIYFHDTTNYINLSSDALQFANNGAERMRIDSSGLVGIGTTSPFSKTQITETGWSSGAPYGTVLTVTGNDTNDANWGHLIITDSSTGTGNGGMLRFAVGSTSSDISPHAGIDGFTEGSNYGGLKFLTRANGGTATERMRIDSFGNVGIGASPNANYRNDGAAAEKFFQVGSAAVLFSDTGVTTALANNCAINNSDARIALSGTNPGSMYEQYQGIHVFYTTDSVAAGNAQTLTARFRISQNGDLAGTDTSISSISDERIKKNIADYSDGLNLIKNLKPRTFEFKDTTGIRKTGTQRGFIAQEVLEHDTYWISEEDATDIKDGEYEYTKDTEKRYLSKLNDKDAMYVSAIQEQQELIETQQTIINDLKSRIETLEG